jgi:hypothetical protein
MLHIKTGASEATGQSRQRLIIAVDTEWVAVREPPKPDTDEQEDSVGPIPPRNIILSYQYACRFLLASGEEPAKQCDWAGIIYTRHAHRLLQPNLSGPQLSEIPERVKLADLLGEAIDRGIKLGRLRAWPTEVIAAGHWTRADLASMADYAEIKNQFDAVRKTYLSLRPYKASFSQKKRRHVRKFDVHLMDTMLLSAGGNFSLDQIRPDVRVPEIGDRRKGGRRGIPPVHIQHGSLPPRSPREVPSLRRAGCRDLRAASAVDGKIL